MAVATKSGRAAVPTIENGTGIRELMAFCPKCKNLQTLWFADGRLVQTRKFAQRCGEVYHDCGSERPCRLYRFS